MRRRQDPDVDIAAPLPFDVHLQAVYKIWNRENTHIVLRMDRLIFGEVLEFCELQSSERFCGFYTQGERTSCPLVFNPNGAATTNIPDENNHTALVDFLFSFLWKYVTVILHFFKCPEGEQKKNKHLETLKNKHQEWDGSRTGRELEPGTGLIGSSVQSWIPSCDRCYKTSNKYCRCRESNKMNRKKDKRNRCALLESTSCLAAYT